MPSSRAHAEVRVGANGPFDRRSAHATLAAHAIDGLHRFDAAKGHLTRWIDINGDPHLVKVILDDRGATLLTATRDRGVNEALATRVQHWFDLDSDPVPINAQLGTDPLFTTGVAERPGVRITRFPAVFEAVVLTVIGQQVSLAAGRLFGSRLVAAYGENMPGDGPRRFPTAPLLAVQPVEELRAAIGLTRSRARTVHEVAELFAAQDSPGRLPARESLHAVHGIGPWTLDYLAIRVGTDPDAFPTTDAVLRTALRSIDPQSLAARIESWSPYRSYAASRLWAGVSPS